MVYPVYDWASEKKVRRLFIYQTRIGVAHKFGTLPIGWYQSHQCHAYDVITEALKEAGIEAAEIRAIKGQLFAFPIRPLDLRGTKKLLFMNLREIYREADNRCRKS